MACCWASGCNNRLSAELRSTKWITFHKWVHHYPLGIVCNTCLCFWYSDKRDFRQWCMVQLAELGSSLWFSRANVVIILMNGSYLQNVSRSIKWVHTKLVRKWSLPCSKAKPENSSLCMHSLMTNDSYLVSACELSSVSSKDWSRAQQCQTKEKLDLLAFKTQHPHPKVFLFQERNTLFIVQLNPQAKN